MKPILVDNCEHFDGRKSECTKCGRSLPDVCLDFEKMKQKAEAYDALSSVSGGTGDSRADDADTPPAPVVTKGNPRAKNAANRR
jgi:hypothetical protein